MAKKHPKNIAIHMVRREIEGGVLSGIETHAHIFLNEKLDDYLIRLGYTNAHVVGAVSQLLTQGKVRIDFRNYVERMELKDPKDRLASVPDAVELLEAYIKEIVQGQAVAAPKVTQNITVEPLKELMKDETSKTGP
jgi:hypothetical protein